MPYGHLIAATVMTLGVCQGRSSIASFSLLTSASRVSAIAELLVGQDGKNRHFVPNISASTGLNTTKISVMVDICMQIRKL